MWKEVKSVRLECDGCGDGFGSDSRENAEARAAKGHIDLKPPTTWRMTGRAHLCNNCYSQIKEMRP